MHDIVHLTGMRRWLCLVDMLQDMAESKNLSAITQAPFVGHNQKESNRLSNVFDWIHANFESNIRLSEAAAIADMNENAFSRFFFFAHAQKHSQGSCRNCVCRKLRGCWRENELSVTEVCYDCGYNNISNFNRQFLHHYHMSPLQYRRSLLREK